MAKAVAAIAAMTWLMLKQLVLSGGWPSKEQMLALEQAVAANVGGQDTKDLLFACKVVRKLVANKQENLSTNPPTKSSHNAKTGKANLGLHAVYSKLNAWLEANGYGIVSLQNADGTTSKTNLLTRRMQSEGIITIRPAQGGVILYLKPDAPIGDDSGRIEHLDDNLV